MDLNNLPNQENQPKDGLAAIVDSPSTAVLTEPDPSSRNFERESGFPDAYLPTERNDEEKDSRVEHHDLQLESVRQGGSDDNATTSQVSGTKLGTHTIDRAASEEEEDCMTVTSKASTGTVIATEKPTTNNSRPWADAPTSLVAPGKSVSTPASISRFQATSTKGKTYVGGMLASSKAMKPFRSPMLARKNGTASTASIDATGDLPMQGGTPSKAPPSSRIGAVNSRKSLLSSAAGPSSTSASSSPIASLSRGKSVNISNSTRPAFPGSAALNKPFKSLFSRQSVSAEASDSPTDHELGELVDIEGKPMSTFQLSTSLPKLERRLALLKDAKRHLLAREKGIDSADNTDHIKELSAKWLEKGREAAELLWVLVKDNMEGQQSDVYGSSGYGDGFEKDKTNSNWGWDTSNVNERHSKARRRQHSNHYWGNTNTVELLREKVSMAIDELSEEDKQALYREAEEEDSLPDLDPDSVMTKVGRKRAFPSRRNDHKKRARLSADSLADQAEANVSSESEHESVQDSEDELANAEDAQSIDNDALSIDDQDHQGEEPSSSPGEVEDNPAGRGMAKMLTSCGIDMRTFGWDAAKEEWNSPGGQSITE